MKNVKFIFSFLALLCFMFVNMSTLSATDYLPTEEAIELAHIEASNVNTILNSGQVQNEEAVFALRLKRAYLLEIATDLKETPNTVEQSLSAAANVIINMFSAPERDPSLFTDNVQADVSRMFEQQ